MSGRRILPLEFDGIAMQAEISCFEDSLLYGKGKPRYHIHIVLTFPRGGWERIIDTDIPIPSDWWDYRRGVWICVDCSSVDIPRSGPPSSSVKWDVVLEACRYKQADNGCICNKQGFPARFPDPKMPMRIRDAVIDLLEANPRILRELMAEDYDEMIASAERDVERARSALELREQRLKTVRARAKRYRPRGIPETPRDDRSPDTPC